MGPNVPYIFTASQGTVMVIDATKNGRAATTPFQIMVNNSTFGVDQISGIVTAFSLTGDSNVQFTNTLRNVIYITAFGDKIGSMSLSGLLFLNNPAVCGPGSSGTSGGIKTFLAKFYEIYVINRKDTVKIALGSDIIVSGFVLGFQVQLVDPQFSIGQFTLQIAALPKPDGV